MKKLVGAMVLATFGVVTVGVGAQSSPTSAPCGGCNQPACQGGPVVPPAKCRKIRQPCLSDCLKNAGSPGEKSACDKRCCDD